MRVEHRVAGVIVAAAVLLAFVSCSQQPQEKYLRVFNWTDYIGQETLAEFEKQSGIHIIYDNYSSNEELISKLQAGGADYDVIFPSGYAVEVLKEKGLLARIDKSRISNIGNLMPEFSRPPSDPNLDYCVPYTWSTTGIGYDASIVSAPQDMTWDILFDPSNKGKILMLDDVRASLGMALLSLGLSPNSTSQDDVGKAKDRLISQKSLVKVYASSNIPQLLASGETPLVYGWSGDILQAAKQNPKVHYSVPREGSLMYVDFMCVPNASKNRSGAQAFINFILEPEASLDIARSIRYATTNSRARDLADPDTRALWAPLDERNALDRFRIITNVGSAIRFYDSAWRELKATEQ